MKTGILEDFQICISVPLIEEDSYFNVKRVIRISKLCVCVFFLDNSELKKITEIMIKSLIYS